MPRLFVMLVGIIAPGLVSFPEFAFAGSPPATGDASLSPQALERLQFLVGVLGTEREFCDMDDCNEGPSLRERQDAAIADLAGFGPAIVPILKPYWKYENSRLRANLLRVFARIGDAASRQMIFSMLSSRDYHVRQGAIESLASLDPLPADAVPRLMRLLEEEDFAGTALEQLVRLAPAQKPATQQTLAKKLRAMIQSNKSGKSYEAVKALGALPPDFPDATPMLLLALQHPDALLQVEAAKLLTLRNAHTDTVVSTLQKLTQNPDAHARAMAISQLGEFDASLARPHLPTARSILADPKAQSAHFLAFQFLARWGTPEDGRLLVELVNSQADAYQRQLLINGLMQVKEPGPEVISLLGTLLRAYSEDRNRPRMSRKNRPAGNEPRTKIAQALGTMGHPGTVELLRALEREHDEKLPVAKAALIGLQGPVKDAPEEIVPLLLDRAHRDKDEVLDAEIVQTLAHGGPRAVQLTQEWSTRGPERRKRLLAKLQETAR
ncbi:HEAT repeat domain-containing protein [Hyalangium gracile]|uniref:HEAT repeat domain-containing protein n=1 Tax=Hyalangium gracile TaxID=394092 RepID=UPI001CCB932D|nr:HEAT repeat domain-containing protein [Hyalangium gracile]